MSQFWRTAAALALPNMKSTVPYVDLAAPVKMAEGVQEERVLVPAEAASVEHGAVGGHRHCYGLVLRRPGRVLECHVPRPEPVPRHAYKSKCNC